jgi:hypothetical protein
VSDPFFTYGPPELCTWRYAPGICRFQTTSPKFARKLSQRRGPLVAWSVNKGYLRIFQEAIEPWRARRLVTRYLGPTNGVSLDDVAPQMMRKVAGRVVCASRRKEPFVGQLRSQNPPVFTTRGDLVPESKAQGRVR